MDNYRILVVDDDREIANAIEIYLKSEGYEVLKAYNGLEALTILNEGKIHCILMDVMMPKMDGIQAIMHIRETSNIPIIILSAKSEDMDKVLGLNIGADDYITKPFNPLEMIARVKSQLRRYMQLGATAEPSSVIQVDGLSIDLEAKTVTLEGEAVKVTPIEYRILELFLTNLNRVFSIDEIYERVWNETSFQSENTVAVHIRRIREKIEIDPKNPRYIKVVWGIGYKIEKN